ncbi:MAG: hypothetical protein ACLR4Z_10885 [Butyricicoccaceae bacterium]
MENLAHSLCAAARAARCCCSSGPGAPRGGGAALPRGPAGSALPALFRSFVAGESLLTVSHADQALSRLSRGPLLRRIYALPQAGAAPVVLGLTGGYPVGAAVCASLLREGRLSASDARREALFCSCASPGFCIALAGVTLFGSAKTGALLYGIQAVSALLTGIFCFPWNGERTNDTGIFRTFRQQTVLRRILLGRASCGGGLSLDVTGCLRLTFFRSCSRPRSRPFPALRRCSCCPRCSSRRAVRLRFQGISPKIRFSCLFRSCFAFGARPSTMQMQAVASRERSRPARPCPRQKLPCTARLAAAPSAARASAVHSRVLCSGFRLCETGLLALRRLRRRARGCYRLYIFYFR